MDMGREKADSDNDTQKMTKFKLQIQDVPARRSPRSGPAPCVTDEKFKMVWRFVDYLIGVRS